MGSPDTGANDINAMAGGGDPQPNELIVVTGEELFCNIKITEIIVNTLTGLRRPLCQLEGDGLALR
jgi:hypothetical protein